MNEDNFDPFPLLRFIADTGTMERLVTVFAGGPRPQEARILGLFDR